MTVCTSNLPCGLKMDGFHCAARASITESAPHSRLNSSMSVNRVISLEPPLKEQGRLSVSRRQPMIFSQS